ncbi:TIGR01212 family radical SAM protein [Treponema sp.]|uniref:TIGR01212 family radical SAM protein n=1 Tax=Treponema sp. TaxID=166 RepID=UPI001E02BCDE|nr:TIGR01212 family radical SAM protein [Treponema sp.]MBS7241318.1 TIGR01212 family radical SAM protein [Treponema sp.]MCI6441720.1 TIGR01212 family radical SAM protein [Spirochaetia bacterium]MDY4132117.1 TIGR01212 family radical SAM protein [Treponema sp.]
MSTLTLNRWLKEKFGCKVYKLSLSTGCTCPNRDGKISTGGCTFCSEGGSGEFGQTSGNIDEQIRKAVEKISSKLPKTKPVKFIAYFQSFSNTYETPGNPFENIADIFHKAISHPEICALSIGTRPDCISGRMIDFLSELNKEKHVWIELGLQTIHEKTAEKINRGYSLDVFCDTYKRLKDKGLSVIVHTILWLPGETKDMMKETASYLAALTPPPDGIKFQLLQILRKTKMAEDYEKNPWSLPGMNEYCSFVKELADLMPEETVLHRLTGDGPKSLLIEPLWCANKRAVLNEMKKHFQLD